MTFWTGEQPDEKLLPTQDNTKKEETPTNMYAFNGIRRSQCLRRGRHFYVFRLTFVIGSWLIKRMNPFMLQNSTCY
jgi:hypothetical protein